MIAFTHNQLLDVTTIASSVPPHLRGIFLRVLAKSLMFVPSTTAGPT